MRPASERRIDWSLVVLVGVASLLMLWVMECMAYRPAPTTAVAAVQQDDPHNGQPDQCTNAKNAPADHKCNCKKVAGACDVEDRKCRVYCRKNHCHCFQPACDS